MPLDVGILRLTLVLESADRHIGKIIGNRCNAQTYVTHALIVSTDSYCFGYQVNVVLLHIPSPEQECYAMSVTFESGSMQEREGLLNSKKFYLTSRAVVL